jgi:hypothetical protein
VSSVPHLVVQPIYISLALPVPITR